MTKTKQQALNLIKQLPEPAMQNVLMYLKFVSLHSHDEIDLNSTEKARLSKIKKRMDKGAYHSLSELL